jgi:hypothetical protein
MAEQRTDVRPARREEVPAPAPVHLMGRQAARAADAAARADGDPNRIEAGALSPTPERLSIGGDRDERMAHEAKNRAAGNHPLRIEEGALTEMAVDDPDEAEKARRERSKLMAENVRAGREPVRIEDGAVTPMPPNVGHNVDFEGAAMAGGEERFARRAPKAED